MLSKTSQNQGFIWEIWVKGKTVEIGASHSLLLPWGCRPTRPPGGCDEDATRTKHAAHRSVGASARSTGGTGSGDPTRRRSTSPPRPRTGQPPPMHLDP